MVKVGLGQRQRLVDPQPGAPQHDDQGTQAMPVTITPGLAHNGDDLINGRRVRGVTLALVAWGDPGAEPWRGRRGTTPPSGVEQLLRRRMARSFESWTITG
jgi:hypothetical protein